MIENKLDQVIDLLRQLLHVAHGVDARELKTENEALQEIKDKKEHKKREPKADPPAVSPDSPLATAPPDFMAVVETIPPEPVKIERRHVTGVLVNIARKKSEDAFDLLKKFGANEVKMLAETDYPKLVEEGAKVLGITLEAALALADAAK